MANFATTYVSHSQVRTRSCQFYTTVCFFVFFTLNQKLKELRIEMVQLRNENMLNKFCFHVATISPLGETTQNSTT